MYIDLLEDLQRDEGLRLKPYRCTAGKLTIGVGRNLEDNGITIAEAMYMLENDLSAVFDDLDRNFDWWQDLPENAQRALANMCFNLGINRLKQFKKMLAAIEKGEWNDAAKEAMNSKWAEQVGARANRIAELYRSCNWEGFLKEEK